jgi:metal-sulfur cluster biosynthetic enzyme
MMGKDISEENVRRTVSQLMHPAIDHSLVDLGMIKDIAVKGKTVTLSLVLPFAGIPIKDNLVNSVREAVTKLGVEVEINVKEMNHEALQAFLAMEQETWKGL